MLKSSHLLRRPAYGARAVSNQAARNLGFCGVLGLAVLIMGWMSMTTTGHAQTPRAATSASAPLRIVAFGDSLTAGFGLAQSQAFPAVLQQALAARGYNVAITNAGVSGDTTSGGLARLDWSIPEGTQAVILELGANDMLRGIDPAVTRQALDAMIKALKARNIPVLLTGMRAAPNLGGPYAQAFEGIFTDLARKYGLTLYPFFLDGVAGNRELALPDGLHPNAQGVAIIVQRILPTVERFIKTLPPAG